MKVSKRVEEFIDVELDSEAVAQLRWVFERANGGHYHEALEPLAKALGVGNNECPDMQQGRPRLRGWNPLVGPPVRRDLMAEGHLPLQRGGA